MYLHFAVEISLAVVDNNFFLSEVDFAEHCGLLDVEHFAPDIRVQLWIPLQRFVQ